MQIKGKKVLVIGAAVTGIPVVKMLSRFGADIILNDFKKTSELVGVIEEIEQLPIKLVAGGHPAKLAEDCDFVVISPGVPLDIPLVQHAKALGKEVISEIELAFRLTSTPIAAITGTNGKTTTTALLGEIMKAGGKNAFVAGNIGNTMINEVENAKPEDVFALEVSSFQLESVSKFKPKVSAILNITPDHLNRHKTMENYIDTKCKIFVNQDDKDYTILNLDDIETSKLVGRPKSNVLLFSRKKEVAQGSFLENGQITVRIDKNKETIINKDRIFIPGDHNLENAMAASLIAYCMGIPSSIIGAALESFKGVEHRIEFVKELEGVIYYNDSKGTNTDASIKAIKAMKRPTLIIAGGYDKGSEYDDFIEAFGNTIKYMVLIGKTADKIEEAAYRHGFINICKAKDLKEAVEKCRLLAEPGDCVLLSPACASWGMFSNYEERGRLFKEYVNEL